MSAWRLWAKAMGTKEGASNQEADKVAIIRTALFAFGLLLSLIGLATNLAIMAGIYHHWDDAKPEICKEQLDGK